MKKIRIFLIILAIIVAIAASLCIWQWQNINAVVDGIRFDEQQLEQQAQQSEKDIADYLENNQIGTIRPLTEEESAAVANGEITDQDAVKISTGKLTLEEAKQNKAEQDKAAVNQQQSETPLQIPEAKPQGNAVTAKPTDENKETQPEQDKQPEQEVPAEVDYDTLISEKVAHLYVVKANFYAEFNNSWAAEKAKFLALPKSEQTRTRKASIVKAYMGAGIAMEQRYDAQVEAIIAELKTLLTQAGRSTELADSIKAAYKQEKKAKKAQLINKYFG